jgi:hypothetical protein
VKSKAKSALCMYGIPGDLSKGEITGLVEWLLSKGRFKYGGMETKVAIQLFFSSL